MARKKATKRIAVDNYIHNGVYRKNIPPAKIAAEGQIPEAKAAQYSYSPHLPPSLRFDPEGFADYSTAIVSKVFSGQSLSASEKDVLRSIANFAEQPWLEWSRKAENHRQQALEVDPVALHIHERVSSNAIIRSAMREDVQRDLFADPEQDYQEAVQFYQHDVDWANRLILGDSLQVMSSLTRREDLAGKVQMIYMDPPYGIRFASNFQSQVGQKDVKDKDSDLSREAEVIKAYRDTWQLGIHSYLSYLRDRLVVARDMLTESGSIFVQISDENSHRVRQLLDEIFGPENFVSLISYVTTSGFQSTTLSRAGDYLLWYSKDRSSVQYNRLYQDKVHGTGYASEYKWLTLPDGSTRALTADEYAGNSPLPEDSRSWRYGPLTSSGWSETGSQDYEYCGVQYRPSANNHWKVSREGLDRLSRAGYLIPRGKSLAYYLYLDAYPVVPLNNMWLDTKWGFDAGTKAFVVQTNQKIVERCILMTTRPGDLVLDPTCGSGTTATVAEQWGRRWITIDTSRVSIAIARQRLLTARHERQRVRGEKIGRGSAGVTKSIDPGADFLYKTVPHITLGSIARSDNLDTILDKHDPILDQKLTELNVTLGDVTDTLRERLVDKLAVKMQNDGIRSVTECDRRRWLLPGTSKDQLKAAFAGKSKLKPKHINENLALVPREGRFNHWNVPFRSDSSWPESVKVALITYRRAWREKCDEVNACISANAEQETMVDQPELVTGVLRVTGPFTVEGVRPEELSLGEDGDLFDPTPNEWDNECNNASAYLDRMLQLLKKDGVTFPNNEHRQFARIGALYDGEFAIHAEAIWANAGQENTDDLECNIAIAFGPQCGPVTAEQVEDLVRSSRRYDELVIAAFSFDGSAQEVIQESVNPRLKIHMAHIRPDISPGMDGLLKDTPNSQLFTVFGQPDVEVRHVEDGELEVELLGVDIYSPLTGEVISAGASKVAAWFLDSDYDNRCFCITQAFFPHQNAWDKIAKSLGSAADPEAFDAYNGTISLPFRPGKHGRIAVKVIDPRGNEVMAIRSLGKEV